MTEPVYDLVAIGGGTAGLVATQGVTGLGGTAALIEEDRPGGDCLWTGCVPSKALISSSRRAHTMSSETNYGVSATGVEIDFAQVMAGVHEAQRIIEPHDSFEKLESEGVDVIKGRGVFVAPGEIAVGDRIVRYRHALIATGSSPFVPPVPGLRESDHLTSSNLWDIDELPERLVVVGAGAIGCELGQAFSRLGSRVTIIEAAPRLLPIEQPIVGDRLAEVFRAEGIDLRLGVMATGTDGSTITLDDGSEVGYDRILVAAGRRPNSSGLGLDTVGVDLDGRGNVIVDETMRTTAKHIFAAGDVTGVMPFTPVAAYEAKLIVTNSLFKARRKANYDNIAYAVFTSPEVARVGMDAESARQEWGSDALIERYDYENLDRAITDRSEGWVELVGDPKRRLVGATVIGPVAGETIAEMSAWITSGAKIDMISSTPHAYPTYSEGPSRAADNVIRGVYFDPAAKKKMGVAMRLVQRLDRWL